MNSCHRIHHSGIYAVFSFVHLLLVLVMFWYSLSCLSVISNSLGISFCFLLEFAHTCISLLHNWCIMLLGPAHTHTVTPWSVYTDQNDLLSSGHHRPFINQKQAHNTNPCDCIKLILCCHNKSKTTRTNVENCTQNEHQHRCLNAVISPKALYTQLLLKMLHAMQSTHFSVAVWDALSLCSLLSLECRLYW